MLTEDDLREVLHAEGFQHRTLSMETLVRRGRRRQLVTRSAGGATTVAVVAMIGVTGVSLSAGPTSSSTLGQAGGQPAAPSVSSAALAGVPSASAAAGTPAPLPSASSLPGAVAPQPTGSPDWSLVSPGTPRATTTIPFGDGTVAYSLRAEPVFGGGDGILLDLAMPDGSATVQVDPGLSAHASKASWWYGRDPVRMTTWAVIGVVPAGATHVQLFIEGKPVPTPVSAVPGASSSAFTVFGTQAIFDADLKSNKSLRLVVSKLTYVDGSGNTITAVPGTSEVQG